MKSFMYQWGNNIKKMSLLVIGMFSLYVIAEMIVLHERYAALFEQFGVWKSIYGIVVMSAMSIMTILLITSFIMTLLYPRR